MTSRVLSAVAVLAGILGVLCRPAWGQCFEYELRVKDGLKKGQSLAIRTFAVRQPVRYDDEPLEEVQKFFAANLLDEIKKLKRFGNTTLISELDPPKADLVLEGTFTTIDEGSRALRVIGGGASAAATVGVVGVIKRSSTDEEILTFSCSSASLGGLIGFARGGKPLIRSGLRAVAAQIAKTISRTDKRPSSAKPAKPKKEKEKKGA
jgi:hypothetical protein